jgi:hypothetical protein
MATYCFKCDGAHDSACTCTVELLMPDASAMNKGRPHHFVRDWRREAVGVQTLQLKREREHGGSSAVRDLFLPTTKDYQSAVDPDGSKGIRQWNEEHDPSPSNKKPLRPESPRKVW